nr:GNAT family N-acetyltransferase [Arthrobacter sp. zg-Y769]
MQLDNPGREDVLKLLAEHLADMFATSPAESVHALDPAALQAPAITFWTVREDGQLLGCGALKQLGPHQGEIKSMRTAEAARGRGVGTRILQMIVVEARSRGYAALLLETGTQDFFAPARRLYQRHGFRPCPPFGGYTADPNSIFLRLDLGSVPPAGPHEE